MKDIYRILNEPGADGLCYDVWQVPIEMPCPVGFTEITPPENFLYPVFDHFSSSWQEDYQRVALLLKKENNELKNRLETTEGAVLDLAEMMMKD